MVKSDTKHSLSYFKTVLSLVKLTHTSLVIAHPNMAIGN